MNAYTEYFLKSKSSIVQLETIEISHPNFTKIYRCVRNNSAGITAKIETDATVAFDYYPMRITSSGARDNLDYGIKIELGDLGEVIPTELDAVASGNGFSTKPVVKYRTYRSDDLETILFGPITLEIGAFSFTREASSFEARAPLLNINGTGEFYTIDRFPMLRGFL